MTPERKEMMDQMAKKGCTAEEIQERLRISKRTFYKYKEEKRFYTKMTPERKEMMDQMAKKGFTAEEIQ